MKELLSLSASISTHPLEENYSGEEPAVKALFPLPAWGSWSDLQTESEQTALRGGPGKHEGTGGDPVSENP